MVGIKDFDMPSCCNSCEHWSFNRDDEPLCDLTYDYISQFDKRLDTCPLVKAIPTEKLVQIREEIADLMRYYDYDAKIKKCLEIIDKAFKEENE